MSAIIRVEASALAAVAVLLVAVLGGGPGGPAAAHADCVSLGGQVVGAECRITSPRVVSGAHSVGQTLRITGTGSLTVPAAAGGNSLSLTIAGDLIMESPTSATGGRIVGDVNAASGFGAAIDVTASGDIVLLGAGSTGARISSSQTGGSCSGGGGGPISLAAGADLVIQPGASVSSIARCSGGEIVLTAGGDMTVGGLVLSEGTRTISRGGPITLSASCGLTVGDQGQVISVGRDPGADLVRLEGGCQVLVHGLVTSTAPGHRTDPQNRCHAPVRPGKRADAAACVEIVSGGTVVIDARAPHTGEVSADTSMSGGVKCCPWIDVFADGDITIHGDAAGPFAVHANQTLSNGFGGDVTIKSRRGKVVLSGLALQAEASNSGGDGGRVIVHAAGPITADEAVLNAAGDGKASGGFGIGGLIALRSFGGALSWRNLPGGVAATGDVQPTGTQVPAGQRGTIELTHCGGTNLSGTTFPANGAPTTPGAPVADCSAAEPDFPAYIAFPDCVCGVPSSPDVGLSLSTLTPTITAGQNASYTLTVTAGGTGPSTGVVLTDPLPPGLDWQVSGPGAGACSIAGGVLTCDFGDLPEGATQTVTLTAATSAAHCGNISNSASVTADVDANPGNNADGPLVIVVQCPDVSVQNTALTPTVTLGSPASFAVTVTGNGPGASTGVVLTEALPAGLAWTVGGPHQDACSISGGTLTCQFGTVGEGDTRSITLSAPTTTVACGTLATTATVSADVDRIRSNNQSAANLTVQCPDVRVNLTTSTSTVTVGDTASYRIQTIANGTGSSTNVVLTDTLPGDLEWTVSGPGAADCAITDGVLTCNFGTLPKGTTRTVTVSAVTTAAVCGGLSNTASVTADVDANLANNTDGPVTITVRCPDVSVAKTAEPAAIEAGGLARYSIVVTAGGTGSSTGVTLSDTLPAGLTWTVSGPNAGSCSPKSPVAGGTTLTCNFGTLPAGATRTIVLTAPTAGAHCPGITNTATVRANIDTNLANNDTGGVPIAVRAVVDRSTAYGEFVALQVLPTHGADLTVGSGPLPVAEGEGPDPYSDTNSVTGATVSSLLTGHVLGTGVLTVNAASPASAGQPVSADATVNGVDLKVLGALLAPLFTLDATVIQSSAAVNGSCGAFTTSGTTTLVGATATLFGAPIVVSATPAPNTVLLDVHAGGLASGRIRVVLNEQHVGGDGDGRRSLTVNAVHVYITDVEILGLGVINGDIIIASSRAERECLAPGQCACAPAASSAFGEHVDLTLVPLLGSPVTVQSGPTPEAAGSGAAPYHDSDSVASVNVAPSLLGQILKTG